MFPVLRARPERVEREQSTLAQWGIACARRGSVERPARGCWTKQIQCEGVRGSEEYEFPAN